MAVATMVRVREDIEVRPLSVGSASLTLDTRDEALAYISEVARIAAGYTDMPVMVSATDQQGEQAIPIPPQTHKA